MYEDRTVADRPARRHPPGADRRAAARPAGASSSPATRRSRPRSTGHRGRRRRDQEAPRRLPRDLPGRGGEEGPREVRRRVRGVREAAQRRAHAGQGGRHAGRESRRTRRRWPPTRRPTPQSPRLSQLNRDIAKNLAADITLEVPSRPACSRSSLLALAILIGVACRVLVATNDPPLRRRDPRSARDAAATTASTDLAHGIDAMADGDLPITVTPVTPLIDNPAQGRARPGRRRGQRHPRPAPSRRSRPTTR